MPVLISYAATEFGGGVAGWNLADHERFWATKRGSVGRAHAGCELRVVDPETGAPLGPDEEGLLEVQGPPDGRRRRLDPHHRPGPHRRRRLPLDPRPGRPGDHPRRVQDPARRRARPRSSATPRVRGAAVVSRADARLGAVPVAAVELRPGAPPVDRRRPARRGGEGAGPLRAARRAPGRRRPAAHRRRARSTSPPCASCSPWSADGSDLQRRGRGLPRRAPGVARGGGPGATARRRRPATGPPAAPTTPRWQRKLHDAGYAGVALAEGVRRPGPAGHPAARVPRGVRRGPTRRTSASTSSA